MKKKITRRDFVRISAIAAGVVAAGSFGIKALISSAELKRHSETRKLLGTFITITLIDNDPDRATGAIEDTFAEISRLSSILSRHDPASKLSILNRTGQLTAAPGELVSVLEQAQACSELTGGAFDVTVLPLVELYRGHYAEEYGGVQNPPPPDEEAVAQVRKLVGYKMLTLKGRDVTLAKPGMAVTLDGIAKGYIVDQATDLLRLRGMTQMLVEAGGDISLRGMRYDGKPWRVGIVHPRAITGYYEVIESSNGSITTSGDYEAAFTADYRHHHIIDPRTGYSPTELSSATVLANETAYADALSTAALVMGMDEALALLERLPGVEALLIDKKLNSRATGGFLAASA